VSTTTRNPNSLSGVFAENTGADERLCFSGPLVVSSQFTGPAGGPMAFDAVLPLQVPFYFDPAAGHLLVDIKNFTGSGAVPVDAEGTAADGASRVVGLDVNATSGAGDTGADVLLIGYQLATNLVAPVIVAQPQDQSVVAGSTVALTAVAGGTPPLSYQWTFNGADLPGATGSTLVLTNVRTEQSGGYAVVISNPAGAVTSRVARLTVYPPPGMQVVVPAGLERREGDGGSWTLGRSQRIQEAYAARLFPPQPIVITELRLRPDAGLGAAFSTTISNFEVRLSTTTRNPDGLNSVFAENTGTDERLCFSGPLVVSSQFTGPTGGPEAFDAVVPLQAPFFYDPAAGHLLVDIKNYTGSGAVPVDAEGVATDGASRVVGLDVNAPSGSRDTGADVLQIVYQPAVTNPPALVVPAGLAEREGNGASGTLDVSHRLQEAYAASLFPPEPILITELRFRPDASLGRAFTAMVSHVEFRLSTTLRPADGLSSTFANNIGPDEGLVFAGALEVSSKFSGPAGGPKGFDIVLPLATPFRYDPAAGNLLLDMKNFSGSGACKLDAEGAGGDGASRVLALNVNASVGSADWAADVLQIIYQPTPPEVPPAIVTQPLDLTVEVGQTATFSVTATGTPPPTYQWRFEGADLAGATEATLILTNVQPSQAGVYSVVVSNSAGWVVSAGAQLTVEPASLARHDLSRDFSLASNPNGVWTYGYAGALSGPFTAFSFSKTAYDDYGLPVEVWARNNFSTPQVNHNATTRTNSIDGGQGLFPPGTVWFYPGPEGTPDNFGVIRFTAPAGGSGQYAVRCAVLPAYAVTLQGDTDFHVVKNGMEVFGVELSGTAGSGYTNTLDLADGDTVDFVIGRGADGLLRGSSLKIEAMLALVSTNPVAPSIVVPPQSQTVLAGSDVTFTVQAGGTPPLAYQWLFNGSAIPGATEAALVLNNVQPGQAGTYAVRVSNGAGTVTSADAVLTVRLPPSLLRVGTVTARSGAVVAVPVEILAQGIENALGFSLGFDPTKLAFMGAALAEGLPHDATLLVNANEAAAGRVGLAMALAPEATLARGTQVVVIVTFDVAPLLTPTSIPVQFGDAPITRRVSDAQAQALPANYVDGAVVIAVVEFEGDAAPRPTGDQALDVLDWVQVGRFAAGLDEVLAAEFQRVDCALRVTLGNGVISLTDWVQAGRYAAGLDPLTLAGGPTGPAGPAPLAVPRKSQAVTPRVLQLPEAGVPAGGSVSLPVLFQALGNENGLGFSVLFDATRLSFTGAAKGAAVSAATLQVNATQAAAGRVGVMLALPAGAVMTAGPTTVVQLDFTAAANASGSNVLAFGDAPILCEVSDAAAGVLPCAYAAGLISFGEAIPPGPPLTAARAGSYLMLYWPASAVDFELEATAGLPGSGWSRVPVTPVQIGDQKVVTLDLAGGQRYFRLRK
jgi:hypothetical protein